MFTEGKFSDVTINIETDHELGAHLALHRVVLATGCEFFDRMFCGEFREGSAYTVKVQVPEGSSVAAVSQALEFIYTKQVTFGPHNVVEVLLAADAFQICTLRELCLQFIEGNISSMPCIALKASQVLDLPGLK